VDHPAHRRYGRRVLVQVPRQRHRCVSMTAMYCTLACVWVDRGCTAGGVCGSAEGPTRHLTRDGPSDPLLRADQGRLSHRGAVVSSVWERESVLQLCLDCEVRFVLRACSRRDDDVAASGERSAAVFSLAATFSRCTIHCGRRDLSFRSTTRSHGAPQPSHRPSLSLDANTGATTVVSLQELEGVRVPLCAYQYDDGGCGGRIGAG
jgi:hypothetical protein